jgi:hypothetical protein
MDETNLLALRKISLKFKPEIFSWTKLDTCECSKLINIPGRLESPQRTPPWTIPVKDF